VDEASYVVARTAGAHRKYYFRQLQAESWTPWTEVKIDCEDMPITPIVWNGRLFLFWLKILKQSSTNPSSMPAPLSPPGVDLSKTLLGSLTLDNLNTSLNSNVKAQAQIAVHAVLCWSEFYNGKWQPTKTSDINRPTSLGFFLDATGPGSFDFKRNILRMIPLEFSGAPLADALVLCIFFPGTSSLQRGGFVLFNTHSLPVAFEDSSLDSGQRNFPAQFRDLVPRVPYTGGSATGTFQGIYDSYIGSGNYTSNTIDILGINQIPHYTDPPPLTLTGWNTPFLFEDRRYLFYVTAGPIPVSASLWSAYGILSTYRSEAVSPTLIRTLVLRQPAFPPVGLNEIPNGIIPSSSDPIAMQRYLSQQTNIRVTLGLTGSIIYQGQEISPIGSIGNLNSGSRDGERSI
jgi:hypothetical protein